MLSVCHSSLLYNIHITPFIKLSQQKVVLLYIYLVYFHDIRYNTSTHTLHCAFWLWYHKIYHVTNNCPANSDLFLGFVGNNCTAMILDIVQRTCWFPFVLWSYHHTMFSTLCPYTHSTKTHILSCADLSTSWAAHSLSIWCHWLARKLLLWTVMMILIVYSIV